MYGTVLLRLGTVQSRTVEAVYGFRRLGRRIKHQLMKSIAELGPKVFRDLGRVDLLEPMAALGARDDIGRGRRPISAMSALRPETIVVSWLSPRGFNQTKSSIPLIIGSKILPVRYGFGRSDARITAVGIRPYTVYGTANSPNSWRMHDESKEWKRRKRASPGKATCAKTSLAEAGHNCGES
ncbi:hypothetical protein FB451DRAFT_1449279 [Mycena latifolia]|nr:hypothetical protein FB451DRAFT_1449279 [Mycena latifolia]